MPWIRMPPNLFARRRPPEPRPPENIRLVYPDGTTIPVECRYAGVQDDVHVWEAVTPAGVRFVPGLQVHVDLLPAKTAVFLPVAEDD